MKKVLYLSNIEVPYRVRFFNELAKHCDLTVLYERKRSTNRDAQWAQSEKQNYCSKYLNGVDISRESAFSFGILKEVFSEYDDVIVGCYNTPSQILAILAMRLVKKPFIINIDGEQFLEASTLKNRVKSVVLRGASHYLAAGRSAAESLKKVVGSTPVTPYLFSSLSSAEVNKNACLLSEQRSGTVLVVGQYFDYKGMDVALEAARKDPSQSYKFVGMGSRTDLFMSDFEGRIPNNVEIVPFLQKAELNKEYQKCSLFVLPSRQECWGLVINEAASFGTPIVSTWGSGAAVDFLSDKYPEFLANPGDAEDLCKCIDRCRNFEEKEKYRQFLLQKSKSYTIEENVRVHLKALGIQAKEEN